VYYESQAGEKRDKLTNSLMGVLTTCFEMQTEKAARAALGWFGKVH
jgi:hypothetical protein